jgi:ABC-type branched-subunit amino acid transport system ATPase component
MKRIAALTLAMGLACGVTLAQEAKDAPATKEDVEKLFATMHIREQMHSLMETMSKQSRQMAQENLKKRFPELAQKDLDRHNQLSDRIWSQMDFDDMLSDTVPVYPHRA